MSDIPDGIPDGIPGGTGENPALGDASPPAAPAPPQDDVRRALALLNAAGARIGTSLDLETTARELLDVAVPQFCDLASVDLLSDVLAGDEPRRSAPTDAGASVRRVAFASAVSPPPRPAPAPGDGSPGGHGGPGDPGEEVTAWPVALGAAHCYAPASTAHRALRTGRVQRVPEPEGLPLTGTVRSTLAVPLVARERVLGVAHFSRVKGSGPFGERDAALAAELASRAAVCVDNARLYRREHERALLLQRSLLPPDDPEAVGLDIACRYLPGSSAGEVGGDWFDVIPLPGHRTAVVVGDVMGRGLRAAVAMGELRTAVRTLALLDLEPAEVMGALDEIARGLGGSGRGAVTDLSEVYLATCLYAVYDPVSRRCTFSNAGHLPPLLLEPGEGAPGDDAAGRTTLLEIPGGVPLGVGGEPFEQTEVELPEGALLALYTDGLVESRDHPLDEGLEALRGALVDAPPSLEDTADHVLRRLDVHHGADDIALLMARVQGMPAQSVGDWRFPPMPRSVARAREMTRDQLEEWHLEALADSVELLVSELVTNALRHGKGEIRLRLLLDQRLVCEVWDADLVQPRRRRAGATDEGGRGLELVGLLSTSWGSRRTPRGKTVWFEMALPDGDSPPPDPAEAMLSLF